MENATYSDCDQLQLKCWKNAIHSLKHILLVFNIYLTLSEIRLIDKINNSEINLIMTDIIQRPT